MASDSSSNKQSLINFTSQNVNMYQNTLTTKQQEILRAINTGDYQYMLDMGILEESQNMNFGITSDGITPLMLACAIGKHMVVDLILKNPDINKNQEDEEGYNCLYYAVFYGHFDIVKKLKDIGIPYIASKNGTTCLHVAVKKNHDKIVSFLLSKTPDDETIQSISYKGPQVSEQDVALVYKYNKHREWESHVHVDEQKANNGVNPAFIAIKQGNLPMLKLLCTYGADMNIECQVAPGQSLRPILLACKLGYTQIVKHILQNSETEIVFSTVSSSLSQPVHMVAYCGKIPILTLLVESGANILARNRYGDTPLHIAIRNNQTQLAKHMIQMCVSGGCKMGSQKLDLENHQEKLTPYMLAVMREQFEIADILLDYKLALADHCNVDGETVNLIASRLGMTKACEYLASKMKTNRKSAIQDENDSKEPKKAPRTPIKPQPDQLQLVRSDHEFSVAANQLGANNGQSFKRVSSQDEIPNSRSVSLNPIIGIKSPTGANQRFKNQNDAKHYFKEQLKVKEIVATQSSVGSGLNSPKFETALKKMDKASLSNHKQLDSEKGRYQAITQRAKKLSEIEVNSNEQRSHDSRGSMGAKTPRINYKAPVRASQASNGPKDRFKGKKQMKYEEDDLDNVNVRDFIKQKKQRL